MARLIIKKYKNTNDKSAAYGKTYGRLVHQDTMNTSDLCRSLLSHSYQAYMFILTQRRRGRRVHAENYYFTHRTDYFLISHRKHRKHRNLLFPADNDNLGPAEMAEMAEILITI